MTCVVFLFVGVRNFTLGTGNVDCAILILYSGGSMNKSGIRAKLQVPMVMILGFPHPTPLFMRVFEPFLIRDNTRAEGIPVPAH